MIPVKRIRTPKGFDAKTRQPGTAWLAAHPDCKRPKDFWSPFKNHLARGFRNLCGYAAMLDPTGGTVDHFLSWKNRPDLAYEWTNYRFASESMNKRKGTADDTVLDPFEVGDGWFEIILPSLQLRLTEAVPAAFRAKAEHTLNRLDLRHGEMVIRWRRQWYVLYKQGKLSLEGLSAVAPLIAAAVRKQLGTSTP